jgi:hypothetical protein
MELRVEVNDDAYKGVEKLANRLKVRVDKVVQACSESMSSYSGELARWGLDLKVRREHRLASLFDEVFFYAVESWRGLVSKVLDRLKARGRFELEMLEFDPDEPGFIMEFAALEGSDLLADRLRIDWGPRDVLVEAYYFLEEGEEPPLQRHGEDYDWSYLPDERAIVVSVSRRSLREVPPIYVLDHYSGLLE